MKIYTYYDLNKLYELFFSKKIGAVELLKYLTQIQLKTIYYF